ncbi:MAG: archaeal proteasome endopeptidase complex subunit beta [Candidatus Bathyarchaeota archaeon]|nr:archaeal proteasome endopeptidase complex subunit beta [Candidatus Termiticorpusculum sp.]MCL1970745.1 archaeal proteasome endopeptidase complex subunit beta [Candidatus Termiticorpusculum sp.]
MERYGFQAQFQSLREIPQMHVMPQGEQNQQQPQGNQAPQSMVWMPGATTVGVVCADGVILASEKRVTYGGFIMSRGGKKVFEVTDQIGVACAGLVGDMQVLAREMDAQAKLFSMDVGRKISVRAASKLMANILFNRRYAPLFTQTIIGGIDDEGATLFVLDVLGSLILDKYAAVGSGTETAISIIEEAYKESITIAEAKDLVKRAIKAAINRDAMSGDGIDFLIITKEGIVEESIKF